MVRNFLDRQYGVVTDELVGKKLYFIFQGSAPTQEVLEMGIILCVAMRGFMEWIIWEW
ncbi:TPA: hypothetical protein ACGO64_000625 [Streptococcus suis]